LIFGILKCGMKEEYSRHTCVVLHPLGNSKSFVGYMYTEVRAEAGHVYLFLKLSWNITGTIELDIWRKYLFFIFVLKVVLISCLGTLREFCKYFCYICFKS
jgi:hypothetical protein